MNARWFTSRREVPTPVRWWRAAGFRLLLLLPLALLAPRVHAHDEGFSGLLVAIEDDSVRFECTIHTRDLGGWFPRTEQPDYEANVAKQLQQIAGTVYDVQLMNAPASLSSANAFVAEPGLIQLTLRYSHPGEPELLKLEFLHFDKLPPGHVQWLIVEDHRGINEGVKPAKLLEDTITRKQPMSAKEIPPSRRPATVPATASVGTGAATTAVTPPVPEPMMESRINYFAYGLEHILFGADHLLFIAALLLVCRTFKEAATIVTFFTIAHSITLALSAMRIVNISPDIIEPAIAATILFVAVENLAHRPKLAWRCVITLFFGLIHGLGFAKDLREKLQSDSFADLVWPLVKFSAGVEVGHLALVALALPLLLWAKRGVPTFDRFAVPALSAVISVFGAIWLVGRIWGVFHGEG